MKKTSSPRKYTKKEKVVLGITPPLYGGMGGLIMYTSGKAHQLPKSLIRLNTSKGIAIGGLAGVGLAHLAIRADRATTRASKWIANKYRGSKLSRRVNKGLDRIAGIE